MRLLHISHTEVISDSRIVKELHALEKLDGCDSVAIGVISRDEGASQSLQPLKAKIFSIKLITKTIFRWMPRALLHSFNMVELTVRFFIRGLKIKPSVVHCHDTFVLPAGLLIKLFTRCKLIYDAHELESNKNGQSQILSKCTLFFEKVCWKRIDLLISFSDSALDWYQGHLGKKNSILVLNSPDDQGFYSHANSKKKSNNYLRNKYNIKKEELIFIYLGLFIPGRGIETILETFSAPSMNAHLVFMGHGSLSAYIQSYCKKHKNIHLHKSVPHHQVVDLASSADIGLCLIEKISLSDYICLPNKFFEYAFSGLTILCSDFPEMRKIVENFSLGTYCDPELNKVREAVQFLINNPPSRPTADLRELSWSRQARRLLIAYQDLLNIKGSPVLE